MCLSLVLPKNIEIGIKRVKPASGEENFACGKFKFPVYNTGPKRFNTWLRCTTEKKIFSSCATAYKAGFHIFLQIPKNNENHFICFFSDVVCRGIDNYPAVIARKMYVTNILATEDNMRDILSLTNLKNIVKVRKNRKKK